jgi:electron transport complex protein RnfA
MEFVALLFTSFLVNNVILTQFLGICPFLGVSKNKADAIGMGSAVVFTVVISTIITWAIRQAILIPLNIEFMQLIVFIFVIAALVQFIEMVLKKYIKSLYKSLGIYLPLITTNCMVLGTALNVSNAGYDFAHMFIYALGTSAGYAAVLIVFSAIRERLATSKVPKAFQGTPIALITASIMALAFMGFGGLF